ncbi:ABC transporter ATP-binding/permease protein [Rickettsiales endosymbiont of Paramecium tredecaurelia]|uniref:ABC transporter ATP-binding protein n=1 Tax=Candidatus Sarmatiella mevalonica TaxID=2770581 RepID=UPI00192486B4|nr:ABC transporter ATP-binding protein [Candidatus Sarmatiella mevalonica]MBL3284620.1 ABC transporter ATP-binding/permease protein [Candidatus Sarmatiella mevalonica]
MQELIKVRPIVDRFFTYYLKQHFKSLSIAIACMIINAICTAAIVKMVEPVVNDLFITKSSKMLLIFPGILFCIYCIKGITEFYQGYIVKLIGQRILTTLQIEMYEHLLYADVYFIQSQSSGKLISRFTNDIVLMRNAISHFLTGCAKHFFSVLFLVLLMFRLEPQLSIAVFLVFPIVILLVQKLGRKLRIICSMIQEELSNYTARLDETFNAIRVIKAFNGEEMEAARGRKITDFMLKLYQKGARAESLIGPISEVVSGLGVATVIWYGGYLIIHESTTPGAVFAFITAFVSAYRPFKSLVVLHSNVQEGITAAKRVFDILDIRSQITSSPWADSPCFSNTPEIVVRNACLDLGSKKILDEVNCDFVAGGITAIIGSSGSGKTSLVHSLIRFMDINGKILIDGYDIKDITTKALREQISFVSQEIILFDGTIKENISYAQDHRTLEQIIEASKLADCHEFIMQMQDGYDTHIGAKGFSLSGGQRQRLAIARTFLRNSNIMILDEATSSLDFKSERRILNNLLTLRRGRTTIVITHRTHAIKFVDRVIVMHGGKIVNTGGIELLSYVH